MNPQSQITAQDLRSLLSCPAPKNLWECSADNEPCCRHGPLASSLEVGSDDPEQLVGGLGVQRARMLLGIDEMRSDVLLNHFRHQSGDRSAHASDLVHDLFATRFSLERTLNCLHLATDTADPSQKSLLFMDGMCHKAAI